MRVNTQHLEERINSLGLKKKFIAEKLGITEKAFYNKVTNKSKFRAAEVIALKVILHLNDEEADNIFFAAGVEI